MTESSKSSLSPFHIRLKRLAAHERHREWARDNEAAGYRAARVAHWPVLEGRPVCIGAKVVPSRRLRAWGRSAIDHGGVITRASGKMLWVRPLKSTRHGFHWLWSRHKEYVIGLDDVERAEPDTTGVILRGSCA